MLAQVQPDLRVRRRELVDQRDQRAADGGAEGGHPDRAGRLRLGVEVAAGGLHGGQDRDRVVGEPTAGRGEADPAPDRLEQRHAHVAGQRGQLLGDRGGRQAELVGDLAHGAQAGELHEQLEPAYVHPGIVRDQ